MSVLQTILPYFFFMRKDKEEEALISTPKRTRKTFEGLEVKLTRIRFLGNLYHPSSKKLLLTLKSTLKKTILIISHNPACANLPKIWQKSNQHIIGL